MVKVLQSFDFIIFLKTIITISGMYVITRAIRKILNIE